MRTSILCFGLSLLIALPVRADTQATDDWYQNSYAPLWREDPWDKLEEGLAFFDETLYLHPPEGTITTVGNYVAGLEGETWVFTQYAEIDCAEHDL